MLIDTNILLRYILQDHADLSCQATKIIVENKAVCLNEVVYESIHVLIKVYEIDRVTVATTLSELFEKQVIESPDTELTKKALQVFKETKLDFVDCLLIAHQSLYQTKIKSFDKKMNRYLDTMSS